MLLGLLGKRNVVGVLGAVAVVVGVIGCLLGWKWGILVVGGAIMAFVGCISPDSYLFSDDP